MVDLQKYYSFNLTTLCDYERIVKNDSIIDAINVYEPNGQYRNASQFHPFPEFQTVSGIKVAQIKHLDTETLIYLAYSSRYVVVKRAANQELVNRGLVFNQEVSAWIDVKKSKLYDTRSNKFVVIEKKYMDKII